MGSGSTKVFTLAEANELIPLVADLTAEVVQQLDAIRQKYKSDESSGSSTEVPGWVLQEVESVLAGWSERVNEIGAVPKGYFTVDFQSVDPELLYCWSYGEERISHTHKVWENFSHRKPIEADLEPTGHMKWIH
jgi:hypothetical protein